MASTLAFDVYGTLIDTNGVVEALKDLVGDKANEFSQTWRNKQLEYSFRRGLMQDYVKFAVCTQQSLEYCCNMYQAELSQEQKQSLLHQYNTLPAFEDAAGCLSDLKLNDCHLYAFSNGDQQAVNGVLTTAGIRKYFIDVISVDDVQTFKPAPDVYQYFLSRSGVKASDSWLISSNPFDIIGAVKSGMQTAWIKRSSNILFDPWEYTPTISIDSLLDLSKHLP